jgi:hypothetical protein
MIDTILKKSLSLAKALCQKNISNGTLKVKENNKKNIRKKEIIFLNFSKRINSIFSVY